VIIIIIVTTVVAKIIKISIFHSYWKHNAT
jgi:hypothetical protein